MATIEKKIVKALNDAIIAYKEGIYTLDELRTRLKEIIRISELI